MPTAMTRPPTAALRDCALTHLPRVPIDVDRAVAQHRAYQAALERLGCTVVSLPPEPALPDAVFVEDTAVVLDEMAVVTTPGAVSRQGEVESVASALAAFRPVRRLSAGARLDGGDVLRIGRRLYVGRSSRSNAAAVADLARWLGPLGYEVQAVAIEGCLHLKTACSYLGDGRLLANPELVDLAAFGELAVVEVDAAEPLAANALALGGSVVFPASFPATAARLAALGYPVVALDTSELQKAEAGVTCMSLILA